MKLIFAVTLDGIEPLAVSPGYFAVGTLRPEDTDERARWRSDAAALIYTARKRFPALGPAPESGWWVLEVTEASRILIPKHGVMCPSPDEPCSCKPDMTPTPASGGLRRVTPHDLFDLAVALGSRSGPLLPLDRPLTRPSAS